MKKKRLIIIFIVIIVILICFFLYSNTGLRVFKREVSKMELPENVEKIAIKSGIGDSGGNGDYYITYCKDKVFKSQRHFTLTFDELEKVEDFSNYYFIEFVK